jgi:hypothetical protein
MMQTNRMSVKDPISLEGFEDLLDRIFEADDKIRLADSRNDSAKLSAPNLVASSITRFSADNVTIVPTVGASVIATHSEWAVSSEQSDQELVVASEQVRGEVILLKARLAYALQALADAKFKEKALRTRVASLEDQLNVVPHLLSKAARLTELESYLEGLIGRLADLA